MKAWIIEQVCDLNTENNPLKLAELPRPEPKKGELLIKVSTYGVCHTEVDEIEERTPSKLYPVVPGHQVVGTVEQGFGTKTSIRPGDRVGIAWIFSACGTCQYCLSGNENLCTDFRATGRDADGSYAEYMVVPENYAYPVPGFYTEAEAAPLLCAGAIGYRSVALAEMSVGNG